MKLIYFVIIGNGLERNAVRCYLSLLVPKFTIP